MDSRKLSLRYQPDLDNELRSIVGDASLSLYRMVRYHLGWVDASGQARLSSGGKMLRPSLCLLACESVGGDWKQALPAAAALELLHNFTLVHDDIEDGDTERRGIPTVWHVWGLPQGVNTGDAMHVLARLAILKLEEKGVSSDKVLCSARLLDETCLSLCEGQCMDISFEDRLDISIDDYLKMINGKTAALFACSLKIGALLGTDDEEQIGHISDFGHNLGLAFQIQDDVLGIWGEDSKTGKSTASDILKKKKTLPVVYALQEASQEQKERLRTVYSQERVGEKDLPIVLEILDVTGARGYAESVAEEHRQKALAALEKAGIDSSTKGDFVALADFMIKREY